MTSNLKVEKRQHIKINILYPKHFRKQNIVLCHPFKLKGTTLQSVISYSTCPDQTLPPPPGDSTESDSSSTESDSDSTESDSGSGEEGVSPCCGKGVFYDKHFYHI